MAKAKLEKAKPEYHRLIIDLDPKDRAKLKRIAEAENRSASRQAKVFIMKGIEDYGDA